MANEYLYALILGAIQGITEFLPISSSGHLVITHHLLGVPEPDLLFNISVHAGTLLAVFVVFRKDLAAVLREPFRAASDRDAWSGPTRLFSTYPALRLLLLIAAASVPTAAIGIAFKDSFERMFSSLPTVGIALIVTGVFLFATCWARPGGRGVLTMTMTAALLVGIAQGCAITPGISRSGATICMALYLGTDREFAGRFSFLAAIPAIIGAEIIGLAGAGDLDTIYLGTLAAGMAAAVVVGYFALRLLLVFLRRGKMYWFAPYCWLAGALVLFSN